uniref:Uncharacterized protein n=1 Tax=Anguilla anguilla TaxID=7936 RepID=A0A0E9T6C8_ANGAN
MSSFSILYISSLMFVLLQNHFFVISFLLMFSP